MGLGEIGLDRTVPPNLWRKQEEVFRKVLSLVRQEKVLILHLPPAGADRIGMDVHARCMQILHKFCVYTQPIHVHCFMGDAELVKEWRLTIPMSISDLLVLLIISVLIRLLAYSQFL